MSDLLKNSPVFPKPLDYNPGISLHHYAAIQLGIPNTGIDWLDEMIEKSNQFKASCNALQGLLSNRRFLQEKHREAEDQVYEAIAGFSISFSNELMNEIKKENE